MKKLEIVILVVISIASGAMATLLVKTYFQTKINRDWKQLTIGPHHGLSFTTKALFESDIPLPDIKQLAGKTKFIDKSSNGNEQTHLGYLITVTIDKLDTSKIPEKYRKEKKEKYKSGEWAVPPVEQVEYKIHFHFTIKDKDGFELLSINSDSHYIESGKVNQFQDIIKEPIPANVAIRTKDIIFAMNVEECATCESD